MESIFLSNTALLILKELLKGHVLLQFPTPGGPPKGQRTQKHRQSSSRLRPNRALRQQHTAATALRRPSRGAGTTTLASVTILTPCVPSQSRVSLHSPLQPFTAPCPSHSPADPGPTPTWGSPYLRHRLLWQESAVPPQWLLLWGECCLLTCSSLHLSSLK